MNAPELRFNGFKGEWIKKSMESLGDFKKGSSLSKSDLSDLGEPCILYGELYTTYGSVIEKVIRKTNRKETNFVYGEKNDVLIPSSGETSFDIACASALNVSRVILGGDLNIFSPHQGIDGKFISYQINGIRKNELSKYGQGATVVHLYSNTLKKFKLFVPSFEEQNKISRFLNLMDIKINQHKLKIVKLEELKKGMMQKIFTQEIRFKDEDGGEFPEWESYLLGEISDVRDGTHDSPKYISKGYPLITSKNLKSNGKISLDGISFISEFDYKQINKRSNVDIGDILFGMIGTIGNPVMVEKSNFAIKNVALIKEKRNLLNKFLIHYLKSQNIDKQFHLEQTGGTQKFIALGIIRSLKINLPIIEEQIKIADYLGKLDKKINIEIEKLKVLQEQKKGYMQQMFI